MKPTPDRSTRTVSAPTEVASSIPCCSRSAVWRSISPDTETSESEGERLATVRRKSFRNTSTRLRASLAVPNPRFACFCLHGLQLVTRAANRHESLRLPRVTLELPSEVRDVEVAGPLVPDVVAVPEMAHDLGTGEDAFRLRREQSEQLQLEGRQHYHLPTDGRLVLREIDLEVAHPQPHAALAAVELAPA